MTTSFKKIATAALATTLSCSIGSAFAADPSHLEHPHSAGTIMLEYKYMRMNMDGILSGTTERSQSSVMGAGYDMAPKSMTMDMHMLMPMYNFTHAFSVMAMFNWLSNSMPMTFNTMKTQGLGDTQLNASYKFLDDTFAVSLDVNLPTGSTTEKTTMYMSETMSHVMTAPYAMQLGSGTYDVTPNLVYLGAYYTWRFGAMASYTYHIGENDSGYAWGDKAKLMAWIRKPVAGVVLDAEVSAAYQGALEGTHESLGNTTMSYTANSVNYGSTTIADAKVGAAVPVGPVSVGLNVGTPVYQKLNGIQMKRSWFMTASVSAMF